MTKLTNEEKELIVGVAKNSNEAEVAIEIMTKYKGFIINKLGQELALLDNDIKKGLWSDKEEFAKGMLESINADIFSIEGEEDETEEEEETK